MTVLILGLVVFLGVHCVRIVADGWRTRQIAAWGDNAWKGVYSVVSIAGFVLLVWGFGQARQHPVLLYVPPLGLRELNSLFTLIAFILLAAAYVPKNHLRTAVHHPMLLATIVWSVGHLLATGMLHDLVLFGAFLFWAIADLVACLRRDRLNLTLYAGGTWVGDALAVIIGAIAWAGFAFWAHAHWIGVAPFA